MVQIHWGSSSNPRRRSRPRLLRGTQQPLSNMSRGGGRFFTLLLTCGMVLVVVALRYGVVWIQNSTSSSLLAMYPENMEHYRPSDRSVSETEQQHVPSSNKNNKHSLKSEKFYTEEQSDWAFNRAPVYHVPQPPKLGRVSCVPTHSRRSNGEKDENKSNNNNQRRNGTTNSTSSSDWMYRTCTYDNLCFDTASREFLLFVNDEHNEHDFSDFIDVAIGGINPRWAMQSPLMEEDGSNNENDDRGIYKVRWSPRLVNAAESAMVYSSYFSLNRILLPFHSMAGHNVGHLLWDDFYPLYQAMRIFGYVSTEEEYNHKGSKDGSSSVLHGGSNNEYDLTWLLMRYILPNATTNNKLYATCDIRRNKRMQCQVNFLKFLPLLGVDPQSFSTTKTWSLIQIKNSSAETLTRPPPKAEKSSVDTKTRPSLVCAPKAVVGTGMLTDHGWNDHGWERSDRTLKNIPHNLGRGRLWYDFAQFMISNNNKHDEHNANLQNKNSADRHEGTNPEMSSAKIGVSASVDSTIPQWPPQITFSLRSSRDWSRRLNFTTQIVSLSTAFQEENRAVEVVVKSYAMNELSVPEQIDVATKTSIFITGCGGGSMTATFLPRNSAIIVYYDAKGGLDFVPRLAKNDQPARLDADLLNHAGHLRVHWLPVQNMDDVDHVSILKKLIFHELAIIQRMNID